MQIPVNLIENAGFDFMVNPCFANIPFDCAQGDGGLDEFAD
jgi:hypothetical protein